MSAPARWGKRPREGDSDAANTFVRFSELNPEQKAERRKQERAEKKNRERTMAYFQSVQRVLAEHTSGSGDPSALAGIVDSVFVEVIKLLRADSTFHLLRNGTVCRVIEAALRNALLLHSKSLLFLFLGHITDLITSPVASYMMETLVASVSLALSTLEAEEPEKYEAEMTEGGAGIHTGSGVPSSATLMRSMVEELTEKAEDLLVHEVGSRALRSVVLVLGGFPIRNAPMPAHPVVFSSLLGTLAEAMVKALEEGYGREYNTASAVETWMAAVQAPTTSFVVQSLLRVCEAGSAADCAVRQRLEGLSYKGEPLLRVLLTDPLGCHVFQAYIKVPTPAWVIALGDKVAQRQSNKDAVAAAAGNKLLMALAESSGDDEDDGKLDTEKSEDINSKLEQCCWSRALRIVEDSLDKLLCPGSELVMQTGFVLRDLALYAPTAAHLTLLWERVLLPRLEAFMDISALAGALTTFARKCAFSGSIEVPEGEEANKDSATTLAVPLDMNEQMQKDEAQNARYFAVPASLQREVCAQLCRTAKARTPKGAAQYFLVKTSMGDAGYVVARCLLHFQPDTSALLQNSVDKLRVEDLVAVSQHHGGSLVLQQYLRASTARRANSSSRAAAAAVASGTTQGGAKMESEVSLRLLRRLQPHLSLLCGDKYGAYVVETIYDVSSVSVKEQLVKALVPIYESYKDYNAGTGASGGGNEGAEAGEQGEAPVGEEALSAADARRFVARKVFTKCCVEQYVHRPDDWMATAQRQVRVQTLLRRMLLA